MATAYAAAARSLLRFSTTARSASSRLSSAAPNLKSKPSSAPSPFRIPKQNLLSAPRILRSPAEMSCCVDSLLPYHTATASSLLTSMLSVTPRGYGWTPEGKDQTR